MALPEKRFRRPFAVPLSVSETMHIEDAVNERTSAPSNRNPSSAAAMDAEFVRMLLERGRGR